MRFAESQYWCHSFIYVVMMPRVQANREIAMETAKKRVSSCTQELETGCDGTHNAEDAVLAAKAAIKAGKDHTNPTDKLAAYDAAQPRISAQRPMATLGRTPTRGLRERY